MKTGRQVAKGDKHLFSSHILWKLHMIKPNCFIALETFHMVFDIYISLNIQQNELTSPKGFAGKKPTNFETSKIIWKEN